MSERPRVLLVGAGAVGQVFAKYLLDAGCDVSFFVREKYADEARQGFTLYSRGLLKRGYAPSTLGGFGVLTSVQEVAARGWEQVWLCVSSTALREGDWLGELARATPGSTWVTLQPALDDRDWVAQFVPAERLVSGVIPFISYRAPLTERESVPAPGTAFWFPPLALGAFSGPEDRLGAVLHALKAGGYPAWRVRDVARTIAVPGAVLTAFVAALESAGWSFQRFVEPASLAHFQATAREAVRVASWRTRTSAALLPLLRPFVFRLLLPLASRLAPFNLEDYLRVHFTKVGAQTRLMLREYRDLGRDAGLPVGHLEDFLR
ncbi:2-dehydropantoate 2-reductase N-terminal domain-containing protein [Myxococcaceae bacterium GXIMD 01537]